MPRCRFCRKSIEWCRTGPKPFPYDPNTGQDHRKTCEKMPGAQFFRDQAQALDGFQGRVYNASDSPPQEPKKLTYRIKPRKNVDG